jgi:hypothetical protein
MGQSAISCRPEARLHRLTLFEALSWLGRVSDGIEAMRQLADMAEVSEVSDRMLNYCDDRVHCSWCSV